MWAFHLCEHLQVLDNQPTKGNVSLGSAFWLPYSLPASFLSWHCWPLVLPCFWDLCCFACTLKALFIALAGRYVQGFPSCSTLSNQVIPLKCQTKLPWIHSSSFCLSGIPASGGLCWDQPFVEAISGSVLAVVAELLKAWLAWTFLGNQGSLANLY